MNKYGGNGVASSNHILPSHEARRSTKLFSGANTMLLNGKGGYGDSPVHERMNAAKQQQPTTVNKNKRKYTDNTAADSIKKRKQCETPLGAFLE